MKHWHALSAMLMALVVSSLTGSALAQYPTSAKPASKSAQPAAPSTARPVRPTQPSEKKTIEPASAQPPTVPLAAAPPPTAPLAAAPLAAAPLAAAQPTDQPRPWLAQPATPQPLEVKKEGLSPWRIGAMALLVAALGGAAMYARRQQKRANGLPNVPSLSVVGAAKVGTKAQIVLTSVAGRLLLVGVTDNSVRKLAWIDNDSEPSPNQENKGPTFDNLLRGLLDEAEDEEPQKPESPAQLVPKANLFREPNAELTSSAAMELALKTHDAIETTVRPKRGSKRSVESASDRRRRPQRSDVESQASGLSRKRRGKRP